MNCQRIVTSNFNGIPYLTTANIVVTETEVTMALGFRPIPPVGYFTVRIPNAIPTGTDGTLPISLKLNGNSRALTFFNGVPVTAADLVGTGVITVFNDRDNGILQMISPAPTATT